MSIHMESRVWFLEHGSQSGCGGMERVTGSSPKSSSPNPACASRFALGTRLWGPPLFPPVYDK